MKPMWEPLAVAFAVALVVTPVLRWVSHRHGLLDHPNERSSHVRPTPRNGGIGIVFGLVAALVLAGEWGDGTFVSVLVGGSVIAGLGFIDDLRTLSAGSKLIVQLGVAAATLIAAGATLRLIEVPWIGEIHFPAWASMTISLLWIVGLTNAYNFMDGVNGIASIEAIVCGGAYSLLFAAQTDSAGALLSLAIAGGAGGFLVHNVTGSIFMGDVGSSALGFLFAALALRLTRQGVPFIAVLLPLLPFLIDTSLTLIKRALRTERLFSAHRTHYYQRLTDLGWSHVAVSAAYGSLATLGASAAIRWRTLNPSGLFWAALGLVVLHSAGAVVIDLRIRGRHS